MNVDWNAARVAAGVYNISFVVVRQSVVVEIELWKMNPWKSIITSEIKMEVIEDFILADKQEL